MVDIESEVWWLRIFKDELSEKAASVEDDPSDEAIEGKEDTDERVDWEDREGTEPAGGSVIIPDA